MLTRKPTISLPIPSTCEKIAITTRRRRPPMTEEILYNLSKTIEKQSEIKQSQLTIELDVSLGHTNYFVDEILENALINTEDATTNKRRTCLYYFTPADLTKHVAVTMRNIKHFKRRRGRITLEITSLEKGINKISTARQVV